MIDAVADTTLLFSQQFVLKQEKQPLATERNEKNTGSAFCRKKMLHEAAGVRADFSLQDKQTPADGLFVARARDGHHTNKIKPLRAARTATTVMQKRKAPPPPLFKCIYTYTHLQRERRAK